jgi:hypothetical protein
MNARTFLGKARPTATNIHEFQTRKTGPLKTALIAILLTFASLTTFGEPTSLSSLPGAPVAVNVKAPRVFSKVDWTVAADVVAVNVLDFTSTERGLAHPDRFRETVLPQSLVHNEAAFIAYKAGITSLEILGQWELSRHGHRKLARIAQAAVIGFTLRTDISNYQLDSMRPVSHGLQPIHAGTPLR